MGHIYICTGYHRRYSHLSFELNSGINKETSGLPKECACINSHTIVFVSKTSHKNNIISASICLLESITTAINLHTYHVTTWFTAYILSRDIVLFHLHLSVFSLCVLLPAYSVTSCHYSIKNALCYKVFLWMCGIGKWCDR